MNSPQRFKATNTRFAGPAQSSLRGGRPDIAITDDELDSIEKAAAILQALADNLHSVDIDEYGDSDRLLDCARFVYKIRQGRRSIFEDPHIADGPAWDILLDLFISEKASRLVSISDATIAACCPASTALRWIQILHEADFIERVRDRSDNRRTFLILSKRGKEKVTEALHACLGL